MSQAFVAFIGAVAAAGVGFAICIILRIEVAAASTPWHGPGNLTLRTRPTPDPAIGEVRES